MGLQALSTSVSEHWQYYIPGAPWLLLGSALSKPRWEACVLGRCLGPHKSSVAGKLPMDCGGHSFTDPVPKGSLLWLLSFLPRPQFGAGTPIC